MTVRNVLQEVPIATRLDLSEKERLEFSAYLRPILKDEMAAKDGDGWDFLAMHVK